MGTRFFLLTFLGLFSVHFSGCSSAPCSLPTGSSSNSVTTSSIVLDPFGVAPLSSIVMVETAQKSNIRLTIPSNSNKVADIVAKSSTCSTSHTIDLAGLKADSTNTVSIDVLNADAVQASEDLSAVTGPLPATMPQFRIDVPYASMSDALFLVNYRPQHFPMVIDANGQVRWYLSVAGQKYGMFILQNGNLAFGSPGASRIYEYSFAGELLNEWPVGPEFEDVHHDVIELPNGNFVVTANKVSEDTIEDFLIELDRSTGEIVNVWDLREILPRRYTQRFDEEDWFHVNAVIYDATDDTLIISGQRQGLVKVTRDNKLKWILSIPQGWEGYEQYLLQPNNLATEPIWGQHAPLIMPGTGNITLFDNGFGRNFGQGNQFSRIVEFNIAESVPVGGSYEQVFEYGRSRGEELWAPIISDVDYSPLTETFLMTAGSLGFNLDYVSAMELNISWDMEGDRAKIIEVNKSGTVLFEATVESSDLVGSVYRSEKIDLN